MLRSKAATAAATTLALAIAPLASASNAAASPASAAPAGTTVLTDNVLPHLDRLARAGAPGANDVVHVTVGLSQPGASERAALAAAEYTKGSAAYHQYLTPAQYAARFAVPQATSDRVISALTEDGLVADYVSPTRTLVELKGSLAQVAHTFSVHFTSYKLADGKVFWANSNAPTVPAGVDRVLGLTDLDRVAASKAQQGLCAPAGNVCVGAVAPQDLWSVYDQPGANLGQGQKIAVVGEGDYLGVIADLRQFEKEFNLPKVNVVVHPVNDPGTDESGEGEFAMDSEASTGMAPDVSELDYYFADSLSDTAAAFAVYANDPNGPLQSNYSVGGCESINLALGTPRVDDPLFQQLTIEGRTQFVSTGDTGGSCTAVTGNGFLNTGAPQAEYPSTSPYVTAVGGTVLYTDGQTPPSRVVEKGWEYTGGGTSQFEPRPAWQNVVGPTEVGQCVVDSQLNPVTGVVPCRGVPDVSALSGDISVLTGAVGRSEAGNGMQDVEGGTATGCDANGNTTSGGTYPCHGSDLADGGTSLASPLWVGMWARIQAASTAAGGAGFAPPALYGDAGDPTKDANDFYNVAVGTNGQWRDMPRSAVDPTGWSYVNGLGTPDVAHLATSIDGSAAPANPTAPIGGGSLTIVTPATSGGGGTTCPPNGVVTNPSPGNAGDANGLGPDDQSIDMQKIVTTYDATTNSLTWTAYVANLSANPQLGKAFSFQFTDHGQQFQLFTEGDPNSAPTFSLDAASAAGLEQTGSGEPTWTPLTSTGLTGAFDTAKNTVSVTMPVSVFNSATSAAGALPLAVGGSLDALVDQSFASEGGNGETVEASMGYFQTVSATCPYVIGTAPGTDLPEAPVPALLAVAALAVAGVVVLRRRRNA